MRTGFSAEGTEQESPARKCRVEPEEDASPEGDETQAGNNFSASKGTPHFLNIELNSSSNDRTA